MAQGSLKLQVTDLVERGIDGTLRIDFQPTRGSTGGTGMRASFPLQGHTQLVVEDVQCRGGPGTVYKVRISTRNFRSYAFFQVIQENRLNAPSDSHVWLMVNAKRVKDIAAPSFSKLRKPLNLLLSNAKMQAPKKEDRDLQGLQGMALYQALGPLRKACLLNIFTKASHVSSARCFRFLRQPFVFRQDRCFCAVDSNMPEHLRKSARFTSAQNLLHKPLSGYRLEDSFKSQDAHANLQVTFMLLTDPVERAMDPRYRFVFG